MRAREEGRREGGREGERERDREETEREERRERERGREGGGSVRERAGGVIKVVKGEGVGVSVREGGVREGGEV